VLAVDARRWDDEQGRQPQARGPASGVDAGGEAFHARGKLLVGLPVTDTLLPAVVNLENVEGQVAQFVQDAK